jgi:hypothetical protein
VVEEVRYNELVRYTYIFTDINFIKVWNIMPTVLVMAEDLVVDYNMWNIIRVNYSVLVVEVDVVPKRIAVNLNVVVL